MIVTEVWEALTEAEALGIRLRLDDGRIRAILPDGDDGQLDHAVGMLRAHRDELVEILHERARLPEMPPRVRLLAWSLKPPPAAIESYSVVVDSDLFARTTLDQLRTALADPHRWVGWTVSQLVERLHQVGVEVAVEPMPARGRQSE